MTVQLTAQLPFGGELTDQYLEVVASHTIGITIQRIPGASDGIINCNVASGQTTAWVKVGRPRVVCGLYGGHGGLTSGGVGYAFESYGNPAVVNEVWINGEQQAVDPVGRRCAERRVIEARGRVDVSGVGRITGNRRHKIVSVLHVHIVTGTAVPCQVHNAEGTDEQADVCANHLFLKAVVLAEARRDEDTECEECEDEASHGHAIVMIN